MNLKQFANYFKYKKARIANSRNRGAKGKVVETMYDKATEKKQENKTTKNANPVNRTQDQSKGNPQTSTTNSSQNTSSSQIQSK